MFTHINNVKEMRAIVMERTRQLWTRESMTYRLDKRGKQSQAKSNSM